MPESTYVLEFTLKEEKVHSVRYQWYGARKTDQMSLYVPNGILEELSNNLPGGPGPWPPTRLRVTLELEA